MKEITKKLGQYEFTASTDGAELHSLKFNGEEYLWQCGDAWKRYAPVLFPFICSPEGRKYRADGKEYTLPGNHGFARDSVFTLSRDDDNGAEFLLESSETTKKWYPYDFKLLVRYELSDGGVRVINKVANTGDNDMYFYLGGHPAFIADIEGGRDVVEYEKPETIVQPTPDGDRTVLDGEKVLELNRAQFDFDVIMKDRPASKAVTLKRANGNFVTVKFPQSECIAVWTATGNPQAQFICLEPWTSVPAYADDEYPDLEKKPHAIKLEAGGEYVYSYTIEFGKL